MMGAGLSLDEAQEFMKDFIIRRQVGSEKGPSRQKTQDLAPTRIPPHVACKVLM